MSYRVRASARGSAGRVCVAAPRAEGRRALDVREPVQGRFKVFMIDEVHMLTGPAFNAMLKTRRSPERPTRVGRRVRRGSGQ